MNWGLKPDATDRIWWSRSRPVVLYRKEGCHLCDAVEAETRALGVAENMTIVDIDRDPALQVAYLLSVPVVTVGGRVVFEAKMMDRGGKWKERLSSLLAG
jgi:hypothetical protein